MRQYLNGGIGNIRYTRPTKLCADVVGTSHISIASQCSGSEIQALLGQVLDERRRIKFGFGKSCTTKDRVTRLDGDRYSGIDTFFSSDKAGERQRGERESQHERQLMQERWKQCDCPGRNRYFEIGR